MKPTEHILRWIGLEDAVACGADVVIQSLHKTMPALTQTALIHINGKLVDRERLRKMLAHLSDIQSVLCVNGLYQPVYDMVGTRRAGTV